jgi:nicotinate phosphoribosyltransferase
MANDFITSKDLPLFTSGGRLSMGAVFVKDKQTSLLGTYDLFIRELPEKRNYFVFAGLENVIEFLLNLRFTEQHLKYFKKVYGFDDEVLEYYRNFRFTGDLEAMPEGTLCFPNEPLIRITAPLPEGMMIEQYILNTIMLQTMQASKLARVMSVVGNKNFGITFSRTHGVDAAMKAVRVAKIVGVQLAALPCAAMKYKSYKPEGGVLAHYFIQSYPDEISAF